MKLDGIKSVIAIAVCVLLAYACFEICGHERVQWVIAIGSFLTLVIPSFFALGVSTQQERSSMMLKVLSWVVFVMEVISNIVFAFFDFSIPFYIIFNGLLLLIYVLTYNSIYRTKM